MLAVQQIGEIFSSVQYALLGKLPVSLVTPVTLHSILTNISLNLPDNYELVAGTKLQDVHLYYELVKVALVGNASNNGATWGYVGLSTFYLGILSGWLHAPTP